MNLFENMLAPGGTILLTDQNRPSTPAMITRIEQLGWSITRRAMKAGNPGQRREQGTLYTINRPG